MGRRITFDDIQLPAEEPTNDLLQDPVLFGTEIVFAVVAVVILALGGLFFWDAVFHSPV
jgi:hypothetical protein